MSGKRVKKEKFEKTSKVLRGIILIEIIIIIILLLRFTNRKELKFNGNGANAGSMESISVFSDEKIKIKENKYTKEGYEFQGWNLYDEKTNTWMCQDGWYTKEEIKENDYKVLSYSTEEVEGYFNGIKKGKITAFALWGKTAKDEIKTLEEENDIQVFDEDISVENETKPLEKKIEKVKKNSSEKVKPMSEEHLEHEYEIIKTKESTCLTAGLIVRKCIVCGNIDMEETEKKGHVFKEEIVKEPTCSEKGITRYICENCDYSYEGIIDKTEHHFEEHIIKDATIEETGTKEIVCSDCGYKYEETIEKLKATDLNILKSNLIDKSLVVEDLNTTKTIGNVTINLGNEIYVEEIENEMPKIVSIEIVFNNKSYVLTLEVSNYPEIEITIIDVDDLIETEFKYNEIYNCIKNGKSTHALSLDRDGSAETYELNSYIGKTENYIYIFNNKAYTKVDEGLYYNIGEVKNNGNTLIVRYGENEIYEYNYDSNFEIIQEETENSNSYLSFDVLQGKYILGEENGTKSVLILTNVGEGVICAEKEDTMLGLISALTHEGPYEIHFTDGTTRQIENPVFVKSYINTSYYYYLYGYFVGRDLHIVETNHSYEFDDNRYVSTYISVEDIKTVSRTDYSISSLQISQTYEYEGIENGKRVVTLMGISEEKEKMYTGNKIGNYDIYMMSVPIKFKYDFIAELEDDTTIDYTGKEVIFADMSWGDNKYDPFGYIEGNELILFSASVTERDENGEAIKFSELSKMGSIQSR